MVHAVNWQAGEVEEVQMHRIGIIPFDIKDDLTALLFVTSIARGRWILPKGLAKPGESHEDTCHRKGFEEAGVRGVVMENFPSTVLISKISKNSVRKVPVTYYPYLVQTQEEDWPEKDQRQRHWTLSQDVGKVAYKNDYHHLLGQFNALEPWIRKVVLQHKS